MKASAIIVHWNTPEQVEVQSSKFKVQNDIEIILIDNNSTKENINKLKSYRLRFGSAPFGKTQGKQGKQDSGYKIIYNNKNLGYAGACNQGAKLAKGEWLLFLNPDTHISSANVLEFVRKTEERKLDAASLQPSSNSYTKPLPSPFSLMIEFSPLGRLIPLSVFKQKTLFGGGLLIRKSVLKNIGGWDEEFFLWFEDSDLTRRLLDNGYKIGWVDVPHTHMGGTSFKRLSDKKRKEIFFTSMNLYAHNHFSPFGQLVIKFITFLNRT